MKERVVLPERAVLPEAIGGCRTQEKTPGEWQS